MLCVSVGLPFTRQLVSIAVGRAADDVKLISTGVGRVADDVFIATAM